MEFGSLVPVFTERLLAKLMQLSSPYVAEWRNPCWPFHCWINAPCWPFCSPASGPRSVNQLYLHWMADSSPHSRGGMWLTTHESRSSTWFYWRGKFVEYLWSITWANCAEAPIHKPLEDCKDLKMRLSPSK